MNTNEKIYELAIRLRCKDRGVNTPYRQNLAHYIEMAKTIFEKGGLDWALNHLRNN